MLQVYNEQIYDLLDEHGVGPLGQRAALRLKEDTLGRVFVAGLSEVRTGAAWPESWLRVTEAACAGLCATALASLSTACHLTWHTAAGGGGQRG